MDLDPDTGTEFKNNPEKIVVRKANFFVIFGDRLFNATILGGMLLYSFLRLITFQGLFHKSWIPKLLQQL